jgi:hypothetical protein
MSERFAQCLRPLFTENLVKDLQAGISLNLVGDPGQGRWRLVEDLRKCSLENTLIVAVNMKSYKQSYDGFVHELWRQFDETAEKGDLGPLLTALEKRNQQVIFWLHEFDALLNNPDIDPHYNLQFMDSLNSIKNHYHWSLVCVTSQAYRRYVFFNEGKPLVSVLDLTPKALPELTFEEIRFELKSRNLSLSSEELAQVTKAIHGQEMSYQWLSAITDNLRNQIDTELSLSKRLEKWRKKFRQLQPNFLRMVYELFKEFRTWLLVFHPLIVLLKKIVKFSIEQLVKRLPK